MVSFRNLVFLSFLLSVFSLSAQSVYYQYGTIGGLLEGRYDGDLNLRQLSQWGDFGLGTFNRLHGEMVLADAQAWQVLADTSKAAVRRCAPTDTVPYAVVCKFTTDTIFYIKSASSLIEFEKIIDPMIKQHGLPTAIQVQASFDTIITRSVAPQTKPYKRLAEAAKQQSVFHFTNTKGSLIGFYTPAALKDIAVAGYHLHFLSDNKQQGGHLLNFVASNLKVSLCWLHQLHVQFPQNLPPVLHASQAETQQVETKK